MARWISYKKSEDDEAKNVAVAVGLLLLMVHLFIGIAIVSDIFMNAIEKICGATRIRKIKEEQDGVVITRTVQVQVWNDTVANLSLMALGSSAPEILLSVIEVSQGLGENYPGDLGPGTIVGSAAFNLMIISAVCILALPPGATSRIKLYKVFVVTCVSSLWAYIWMVIVLQWNSPDVVEIWEAVLTLLMCPLLVLVAYWADKDFCISGINEETEEVAESVEQGERSFYFGNEQDNLYNDDGSVNKESLQNLYNRLVEIADLTEEEISTLLALKLIQGKHHNKMWYRNEAARGLMGGAHLKPVLDEKLEEVYDAITASKKKKKMKKLVVRSRSAIITPEIYLKKAVVEFQAATLAVKEGVGHVPVTIHRNGKQDIGFKIKVESHDGTARKGKEYVSVSQVVSFDPYVKEQVVTVKIIDNIQWNPDSNFFLKLSVQEKSKEKAVAGQMSVIEIIIEDDDNPGILSFGKKGYLFDGIKNAHIDVERNDGSDGIVSVKWKVIPGPKCTIVRPNLDGKLEFHHREKKKFIEIFFVDLVGPVVGNNENFSVELEHPEGGAKLGKIRKTMCAVSSDKKFKLEITDVMTQALKISEEAEEEPGYCDQIKQSLFVNGGDTASATMKDWIMHLLTFPYKVAFSLIPPPHVCRGWPCFFLALMAVGLLTKIVGDAADCFGMALGIDPTITAITIVALGTSLPDTFASRIAAKNDKTADNAVGNITGSNSVNVFLGLGIPWTIGAFYYQSHPAPEQMFCVPAGSLTFNVIIFTLCAVCAIGILTWRRFSAAAGNAELGGPSGVKWTSAVVLIILWFLYVALSSLEATVEESHKRNNISLEDRTDILALIKMTNPVTADSIRCIQLVEEGRQREKSQ